jgi:hypothetical protein
MQQQQQVQPKDRRASMRCSLMTPENACGVFAPRRAADDLLVSWQLTELRRGRARQGGRRGHSAGDHHAWINRGKEPCRDRVPADGFQAAVMSSGVRLR